MSVEEKRIVEYVKYSDLEFWPGTHWKYSNTGFYLLGLIIEIYEVLRLPILGSILVLTSRL